MSKIKNEKVEVENSIELNDQDFLNDILETEKNMSNNLSIALNEMSNKVLFKEIFDIFKDSKDLAREAYCIAFQNGWYTFFGSFIIYMVFLLCCCYNSLTRSISD